MAELALLGDVGGTHTRLCLADAQGPREDTLRRLANRDFASFPAMLSSFLEALRPGRLAAVCLGVAGPSRGGAARLTNHPWEIRATEIAALTGARAVHLLNDLQAQGLALDDLPGDRVQTLFPGTAPPEGAPRLVINLGTGFNAAAVHRHAGGLFVPAAESGHSALPWMPGQAGALFEHLRREHPHLPVEAALSGPGLAAIHAFLHGARRSPPEIVAEARAGAPPARESLALLALVLGNVAGSLALHHLPLAGLCLTGGLARAIAPVLAETGFHAAFCARGRYGEILRGIPIRVILDDGAALPGCARHLRQTGA